MYDAYVTGIHMPPLVKSENAAARFENDSPSLTNGQANVYAGSSRRMKSNPTDGAKRAAVATAKAAATLEILEIKAQEQFRVGLHLLH